MSDHSLCLLKDVGQSDMMNNSYLSKTGATAHACVTRELICERLHKYVPTCQGLSLLETSVHF